MKKPGKSKFDLAVIALVKQIREEKRFTQDDLALFIDVDRSYIGHVESPDSRAKYNLNQLNRLAYEMGCSPKDFIPDEAFAEVVKSGRKKQKK